MVSGNQTLGELRRAWIDAPYSARCGPNADPAVVGVRVVVKRIQIGPDIVGSFGQHVGWGGGFLGMVD